MAFKERIGLISYDFRWLLILLCSYVSYGTPTDVTCLRKLKASIEDPQNYLNATWDFSNKTEGAICKFYGVECWHPDESRVLNIKLTDLSLKGRFPEGLEYCTTMTGLDLSSNKLSGPLPVNISKVIPFVTNLDLSDNAFTGQIPESLANCTFLNDLDLGNNQFSGQIPLQLGTYGRIRSFNVANNGLSGPIPRFIATIPKENFANNTGLCGNPLDACNNKPHFASKSSFWYAAAGSGCLAFVITFTLASTAWSKKTLDGFWLRRKAVHVMPEVNDPQGNIWAQTIKGAKAVKITMFEKSNPTMSLDDLMNSTNLFSNDYIVSSGLTGTMYMAMLPNGMHLMVKGLQTSRQWKKEFLLEMNVLGSLKHPNLIPLLGFCIVKKERLLVYKYMANGNLYDQLHPSSPQSFKIEWPIRLKIAIGVAKGVTWLHQNRRLRVIHPNMSSECILLDEHFEPKLSDFGLSRLTNPNEAQFSIFVMGDFGDLAYAAPEYSHVYSFGIVLLELITGEKPTQVSLVRRIAERLSTNSDLHSVIDKYLLGKGVDDELFQFLTIACHSISPVPKERPEMVQVYQQLKAIGEKYHFTDHEDILVPESQLSS